MCTTLHAGLLLLKLHVLIVAETGAGCLWTLIVFETGTEPRDELTELSRQR